jgi:hypothetical protein
MLTLKPACIRLHILIMKYRYENQSLAAAALHSVVLLSIKSSDRPYLVITMPHWLYPFIPPVRLRSVAAFCSYL